MKCLIKLCSFILLLSGCRQLMYKQNKGLPYSATLKSQGEPIPLTEAFGAEDTSLESGVDAAGFVRKSPLPVSEESLRRGQQRYAIFCVPCHGLQGEGDGIVVQRGFIPPPSYHIDRLREAPDGYLFTVMSTGLLRMPQFSSRIAAEDRWAITQYIRVLQASQAKETAPDQEDGK